MRVEELVNYFDYDYSTPRGSRPFAVNAEVSDCPWNDEARLVQIGIKGKEINQEQTLGGTWSSCSTCRDR